MTQDQRNKYLALLTFVFLIFVDQIWKLRAVLASKYILNRGLAFGLFEVNSIGIVVGLIALSIILYLIFIRRIALFPLTILAAAITSNIVDRFIRHGVVDNLNFFGFFRFNFADFLICLVLALWLFDYLMQKSNRK